MSVMHTLAPADLVLLLLLLLVWCSRWSLSLG
jgi:hypothetical protein